MRARRGYGSSRTDAKRHNLQGVKLYTAEWHNGSRGWTLKDREAQFFLEKCGELGIKNIHVHKGPTIWPLDKDAFDVRDVDYAATSFPELNFVVEHVGLPRIEDFCFMATQEPNVYAGLAVVIGGLMHARPRFFAKVMGELLFWVGEDKMLFGSDYAIWEPQLADRGLRRLELPGRRRVLRLPRGHDRDQEEDPRPQRGQALRHRGAAGAPAAGRGRHTGGEGGRAASRRHRMTTRASVLDALSGVHDPELDEPITSLRFVSSCEVTPDGDVEVVLRLPTPQCAPNFAYLMAADARNAVRRLPEVREVTVTLEDHYTGDEINLALARGEGFTGAFPGETDDDELEALRQLFERKALRRAPVAAVRGAAGGRRDGRGAGGAARGRPARRRRRPAAASSSASGSASAPAPTRPPSCCRTAARLRPPISIAGCGWPGSCAPASRRMGASAAPFCNSATGWRPNPRRLRR